MFEIQRPFSGIMNFTRLNLRTVRGAPIFETLLFKVIFRQSSQKVADSLLFVEKCTYNTFTYV